jgi:GAF domain-containing protein
MSHAPDDAVRVAELFGQVARLLAARGDQQSTLDRIVGLAVANLDACEYAGITVIEQGHVGSPASSNDVPRILDRIQAETGEGPCVDAIVEQAVFETGDLPSESRWPNFSARGSAETGVRSIVSLRLFIEQDTMGALNLYSTARDAFDDSDVALGSVFAVHAAVAMQSSRREAQLEAKAATRDVIGQAKGILMARSGVDEARAFEMLRAASQRSNLKLRQIAEDIAGGKPLY